MLDQQSNLWWQTALHTVAAFLLFVPAIVVSGFFVTIMDFMQEGYIGRTGEGIGFIMRGVQYALASGASVAIPHQVLKRSHVVVVTTIFTTLLCILVAMIFFGLVTSRSGSIGIYGWAEFVASSVGLIGGAIYYAFNYD